MADRTPEVGELAKWHGHEWRVAAVREWPYSYVELATPCGARTVAPLNRIDLGPAPERGKPWLYDDAGTLAWCIAEAMRP